MAAQNRAARLKPKSRYRNMTPGKAAQIRQAYKPGEATQTMLAERFGVSQSTICRIISGQTW